MRWISNRSTPTTKYRQQGLILLLFVAVLFSAGVGLLVAVAEQKIVAQRSDRTTNIMNELNGIKKRLLTFAAAHPELYADTLDPDPGPGYFPCPSNQPNAGADGNCSDGEIAVGWVPRANLGLGTDFTDQIIPWRQLLFVVDLRYALDTSDDGCGDLSHAGSRCEALNHSVTADRIRLGGGSDYVALIIFSGNNLTDQQRTDEEFELTDYLEGENADGDGDFEQRILNEQNDIIVGITQAEWVEWMRSRIKLDCSAGVMPDWYTRNNWNQDPILQGAGCPL